MSGSGIVADHADRVTGIRPAHRAATERDQGATRTARRPRGQGPDD
jgi:hypothetical protein